MVRTEYILIMVETIYITASTERRDVLMDGLAPPHHIAHNSGSADE
jgi:hypothetical protein